MSPDLTLHDYRDLLERIYGVVAPWEAILHASDDPTVQQISPSRARRDLLRSDLYHLGSDPEVIPLAPLPDFSDRYRVFGGMYVMEGSRLGGQLLSRHLAAKFPSPDRSITSYFEGFGTRTGTMWKELIRVLEVEVPEPESQAVIDGAHAMFKRFGTWVGKTAAPPRVEQTSPQVPSGGL